YWQEQVAELEVTAAARQIMAELFAARSAPAWLRGLMPQAEFLTAGLLPADIRSTLGLDWVGADSLREARVWRILRSAYPRLPAGVRQAPARFVVAGLPTSPDI